MNKKTMMQKEFSFIPKKKVAFEKAPQNFCLEKILKDAKIRIPGFPMKVLTNKRMTCYHSIIPGWNKKNGWLGIPYYQGFVEFPINNDCTWRNNVEKRNFGFDFVDNVGICFPCFFSGCFAGCAQQ